jgi:chromosome segregation protein
MRVEKIEINGFKSFADRTVFTLHPGVTCIVGPNGCGKSNIVDSFKWVLGEQSAKSLRGEKMEEVIFAGSQTKKPKGMAEVALHVSGIDDSGNGDATLTTVTRRLYRSGDSDYMLNKSVCRLKDIKDLFLDTGLEMKSYSIFEQDRIAAIINARPEDRRFLIEEVAGVVKYKVRRHEANLKLESSRQNLQRINDIVAEIKRQINSLDRQVRKAERYKRLMAELKDVELRIAKGEFDSLKASLEGIVSEHSILKEKETSLRAELSKTEVELEALRLAMAEKEKRLNETLSVFQSVEKDVSELERDVAVLRTEIENLEGYLPRLSARYDDAGERLKSLNERADGIHSIEEGLSAELDGLKEALGNKNASLKEDEDAISVKETLIEAKRKDSFGISEGLSLFRNELHTINVALDTLKRRQENILKESEDSSKSLDETDSALKGTGSSVVSKTQQLGELSEEKEIIKKQITGLEEKLEATKKDMGALREALASDISRLDALSEIVYDRTAEDMLSGLRKAASMPDVINVPKEYEKAIEAALREMVNCLIVEGTEDALLAVRNLRGSDIGRTAFMPKDTRPKYKDKELPQGVIGRASELLHIEGGFETVVKNLLYDVVIVEDLSSAVGLKDSHDFLFVTLEGETIEPSGAFIGGRAKGVLMRKRQTREIASEIEEKKIRIKDMEDAIENTAVLLGEKKETLGSVETKAIEIEKEISLLKATLERYNEEIQRTGRKLSFLKIETEEIEREKESALRETAKKEDDIKRAEEEKTKFDEEAAALSEELSNGKTLLEKQRSDAFDLRLSINSAKERMDALASELESTLVLSEELRDKRRLIEKESEETKAKIAERRKETENKEEGLGALVVKADAMKMEISRQKEQMGKESEDVYIKERSIRSLRSLMEPLMHSLNALDVKRAEHRLQMENIGENIKVNHDLDIEAVEAGQYSPEDMDVRSELRRKIQELGPVSLGTIEEYEELKQRSDFLTKQRDDLVKSIAELEEAITRINSTTRKKLREAYDGLKVKFSEMFVALFGGGRAELILTDEGNILETGIDIIAQPPGKKQQNINLLSGGEKVLTALSLLFAGFLIKPTPLCILDEADAALDESNTEKFSQTLKTLSKDIQFIVVTHNKVTMESADYIYGITMEEPGVSKVISIEMQPA